MALFEILYASPSCRAQARTGPLTPPALRLPQSLQPASPSWAYLLLTSQVALQLPDLALRLLQGLLRSAFLLTDALLQSLQPTAVVESTCCHGRRWTLPGPRVVCVSTFSTAHAGQGRGARGSVCSKEADLCEDLSWILATVSLD